MVYGINILRIEYCQKTTPLRWIVGEEERKGKEKEKKKEKKKEDKIQRWSRSSLRCEKNIYIYTKGDFSLTKQNKKKKRKKENTFHEQIGICTLLLIPLPIDSVNQRNKKKAKGRSCVCVKFFVLFSFFF